VFWGVVAGHGGDPLHGQFSRAGAAARGCEILTRTYKSFMSSLPYKNMISSLPYSSFIASGSQRTTLPLS
jgi:hypothetical protein